MSRSLVPVLALLLPSLAPAAEFDVKVVDALAEKALADFECPGLAIALIKDDRVLLARGYGVREIGRKEPITASTLFALASCSKAFTAAAAGALVDEHKMNWDDLVSSHLPDFRMAYPLADRTVTLRDCLCHRTGLSRHDVLWIEAPQSRAALIRRIGQLPPTTSFRSTWEYNNLMFLVAGQAVGAVGGGWEEVVQRKLFDPLGMKTADFSTKTAEKREHARPHRRRDDNTIESFPWENIDQIGPAGSINANVRELCSWLRMQLGAGKLAGRTILSPGVVKEMHTPQMVVRNEGYFSIFFPPDVTEYLSYGLGWFIYSYRGQHCISHGGSLEGFRAQMILVPKHRLGIVVLCNLGSCRLPEALSKNLIDRMLGLPERDWNAHYVALDRKLRKGWEETLAKRQAERKKDTHPSLGLADYAGAFTAPGYGQATVLVGEEGLRLLWNGFTLKLEHFHFDTFSFRVPYKGWTDDRVTFVLDGAGKVARIAFLGREFTKR
jgi:CubicO group peptidase (beta-lactamase class C family)